MVDGEWRKISPNASFIVTATDYISDLQRKTLDLLYQPIIGQTAYALVNILWRMESDNEKFQIKNNFELLSLLNIDLSEFYDARVKLEGAGLLKTYVQATDSLNNIYVYKLFSPLDVKEFFKDDLLSITLLQMIGEKQYYDLGTKLIKKVYSSNDLKDISKNFLDVFVVKKDDLANTPDVTKKIRSSLSDDNNTKHKIVNDVKDFDFNLLLDILSQSYVNLDSVKKSHDLILSEHLLYGIDEISTSKFVEKATNINTNNLDVNKFKLLVSRQFDNVKLNKVPKKASKDETVKLSSVERGLVKSADFYAPIDFLYQLKKLNKGYVSSNEERILRELVHRMILPKEVINMITYHILIDQGNASLNKNLVDTIANDWAKNNISSAAGAIEYIRNRKSTQTKSYKKSFSIHKNSNIKQIKESLPEWARDDYNPRKNNKPIDKNKKRQLELELEELDNNK
ncbi:DnaD domain protein [Apilactobacillus ozensis]|uniref:DnaD domain protein n=1 Tax=Apilactobacillus ozensis TaxID=866801 RepID=UPI00200ABBA4|nr:DnaD domain protein [Apilactobacillus ozensis]MCK8606631.1 DnaD domain protein [Apilactobacillus ozensis]